MFYVPPLASLFSAKDFATYYKQKIDHFTESLQLFCTTAQSTSPYILFLYYYLWKAFHFTLQTTPHYLCSVPSHLVANLTTVSIPALTLIFNLLLTTSIFSSSIKHVTITPRLQKPSTDPSSLSSYCPISLLLFASQLLEQHVHNTLFSHLSSHFLTRYNLTSDPTTLLKPP